MQFEPRILAQHNNPHIEVIRGLQGLVNALICLFAIVTIAIRPTN